MRAGRTLRTPEFTLTHGKAYALVKGSGMIYAGVGNNNNGIDEGGNTFPPPSTTPNPNMLTSLGSKVVRFDRNGTAG